MLDVYIYSLRYNVADVHELAISETNDSLRNGDLYSRFRISVGEVVSLLVQPVPENSKPGAQF